MSGRTDTDVKGGLSAAFFTLGCRVNQYETRAMEEDFLAHGFRLAALTRSATFTSSTPVR